MKYTFSLILTAGGTTMEAREMCANWDDVVLAFKRNDYDGVVRTFTTKFEFVGDARSLIISKYLQDGMRAAVSVSFRKMGSDWQFSEVFASQLDFTTLNYDDTTAEISAVDNSAAAIIKAKKSTQFTLPFSRFTGTLFMDYRGVPSIGKGFFIIPNAMTFNYSQNGTRYATAATWLDYDVQPDYGTIHNEFPDQTSIIYGSGATLEDRLISMQGQSLLTLAKKTSIGVKADFTLNVSSYSASEQARCTIAVYDSINGIRKLASHTLASGTSTRITEDFSVVDVYDGGFVLIYLTLPETGITITPESTNTIAVYYYGDAAQKFIPIIRPLQLMSRLLQAMGVDTDVYTYGIDTADARLDDYTFLTSGDLINRGRNGNVVTSWADFEEWMSAVFGYVFELNETAKTLTFKHRSAVFGSNETEISNYKDFNFKVQNSFAYSQIIVGYNKEERDNSEFANEFLAGALTLSTGISNNDKTLTIKTKYKCAPHIIEDAMRHIDPTDSSSSDMYFIGLARMAAYGNALSPIKQGTTPSAPTVTGCGDNEAVFNAMYNQREMIKANWARIAPAAGLTLAFADFEGNQNAAVGGVKIASDFSAGNNLQGIYSAAEFTIETDDNTILSDWGGIFNVWNRGKIYSGYLKDVSFTIAHPESVKYTFILKEID